MAIYLNEDCLGLDDTLIGFPHLLLCMGVVLLTRNFMYGVHIVTASNQSATIPEFGNFLATQGVIPSDMISLYGSCNFKVRYGDNQRTEAWKTELRHIAGVIGFTGKAKGFDTSIIDPVDGTYVEYVRNPVSDKCKIFYKRNEKMNFTGYVQNVNFVKRGLNPVTLLPTSSLVPGFTHSNANVIHTASNKGQLHEVNYFLRLKEFTI
jgi:hypothetical protein